jgi:dephospho-CoA kinase
VGLVGGVGSGKSALARRVAQEFGVAVIDGDVAGHRALARDDVKAKLRSRFGNAIFTPDGSVDRSALARRVFGPTPEHTAARGDLEGITHPVIRRSLREEIDRACAAGATAVFLDAAVLLEAGWETLCETIVFVEATDEVRSTRAAARGWSADEWRRREASQLPLDEKRRRSHASVENSGSLDHAAAALARIMERLCGVRLSRLVAEAPA